MLIAGINNNISWACSLSMTLDSVGKVRRVYVPADDVIHCETRGQDQRQSSLCAQTAL